MIRVEPWTESGGYSEGCYREGVRDGMIRYWGEGYLNLEGSFRNGRKEGPWTVFNADGSVFAVIYFEAGVKKWKRYHGKNEKQGK